MFQGSCPIEKSDSDGNEVSFIIGGWRGDWLHNVTILHSDGKQCPGPKLPIWLADHFSVVINDKIMTCGGRSNDDRTLCWHLDMSEGDTWTRTSNMLTGRSYADAVTNKRGDVWVTGRLLETCRNQKHIRQIIN